MWHYAISVKTVPQEISVSALFQPQRPPSVVGRLGGGGGGGGEKARARDFPARLLLFDYGYPAGASAFADETGQCDKRGAEMI